MTNRKRKKRQAGAVPKKIVTPVYNQILVQPVHRGINDIGTVSYTHLTLPTT